MALHRPLCPDGRGAGDLDAVAHCPEGSRPFVLAATILASAMGFIDGTVVTIALPSIQKDFGADFTTLQWVVNGYALMLGSLILVGGGAGDKFGRRRVFLIGIGLFVLASLCCALAPGLAALIFARICQGIGAALMIPQSLAIIAASFPKDVRGRAIGIWAGASAITTALGPPLGGFLIDILSWRAAFWINVPIAAAVVWLTLRHVPESRSEDAEGGLDWTGGVLAVIGFGALTLSLTTASQTAAFSVSALMWLALGVVGIVAFLVTEHRVKQPLMPPSLFKSKSFTGANLTTLFLYGAFTAMLFLLPFDLIGLRGYSSAEVGLILLPIGLVIGVASRSAGHWADHTGPRLPLILGSLIVAVARRRLRAQSAEFLDRRISAHPRRISRNGRRRGTADDGCHERGAQCAVRRGFGHQQCREPDRGSVRRRDRRLGRHDRISERSGGRGHRERRREAAFRKLSGCLVGGAPSHRSGVSPRL